MQDATHHYDVLIVGAGNAACCAAHAAIEMVFAPAGTPAAFVARMNREIAAILGVPETKERFLKAGVEVVGGTPREAHATVKAEMARWGKVIREAQIRDQ